MASTSYLSDALILSILLRDEQEYKEQGDYLMGLLSGGHTEAYQEQAAWCWLHKFHHKLRP